MGPTPSGGLAGADLVLVYAHDRLGIVFDGIKAYGQQMSLLAAYALHHGDVARAAFEFTASGGRGLPASLILLHGVVVAVLLIPVDHQVFAGKHFFIGEALNVGRGVKADEGSVAAVQLRVYREIQADAVGVGLAVVQAVETRELYAMITRTFGSSVSTPATTERLSPEMSISVGYHLAVDGVFDALSLGDDLAHEDMFCIQTF